MVTLRRRCKDRLGGSYKERWSWGDSSVSFQRRPCLILLHQSATDFEPQKKGMMLGEVAPSSWAASGGGGWQLTVLTAEEAESPKFITVN